MHSVNIDLFDPNIKEKLAVLPEKMADYAEEVLLDAAHLIVGLAQVYCPVDTGSLRDSIRVERGGQGMRWRQVSVRAGGYVTNPKTGRKVDYAWYVEYGVYPFMTTAIAEVQPTIRTMLENNVLEKALT
jgi:hypothetical protein